MSIGNLQGPPRGLDDVVALRSAICQLSASDGRLAYRGYDVRVLAEQSSYEETAYLLLHGQLPTGAELRLFTGQLRAQEKLSPAALRILKGLPNGAAAMGALQLVVAGLALERPSPLPP
ncbi:MAG TPA: citrate/2-methylcitrate synthase, partial [Gemmatimonadales bacterium]|nr:citrate/2-methylcitrate synthase [Gemmatimonadales bacterium]